MKTHCTDCDYSCGNERCMYYQTHFAWKIIFDYAEKVQEKEKEKI